MNVTIIYGNNEKTATYNCVQLLLNNLKSKISIINITEVFLSQDSLYFIKSSIYKTYARKYTNNINSVVTPLVNSDLIIFASPIFLCDINTEMKDFLNNLSNSLANKSYLMKNKIGLAVVTTAGAGLFRTTKILQKNLNSLGIHNILKFSKTLYESNWKEVNIRAKKQIHEKLMKLSYRILLLYNDLSPSAHSNLNNITYFKIEPKIKNNSYHIINLNYWKKQISYHSRHI